MESNNYTTVHPGLPSKASTIVGWILGILPVIMLLWSGSMKVISAPQVVKGFADFGFSQKVIVPLGIIEIVCTIIYLIPQTAVLGAILLTGYFGGAICTHLRAGQAVLVFPFLFGVLLWLGLFLRDTRIRALIPLRR